MTQSVHFVAADLGASSGRLMVGRGMAASFLLDELHRFPNTGVASQVAVYWDALGIWSRNRSRT